MGNWKKIPPTPFSRQVMAVIRDSESADDAQDPYERKPSKVNESPFGSVTPLNTYGETGCSSRTSNQIPTLCGTYQSEPDAFVQLVMKSSSVPPKTPIS